MRPENDFVKLRYTPTITINPFIFQDDKIKTAEWQKADWIFRSIVTVLFLQEAAIDKGALVNRKEILKETRAGAARFGG